MWLEAHLNRLRAVQLWGPASPLQGHLAWTSDFRSSFDVDGATRACGTMPAHWQSQSHTMGQGSVPRCASVAWLCLLLSALAASSHPEVQLPAHVAWHRREAARGAVRNAYGAYMNHAYPADELKPLSCSPRNWNRKSRGTLDDVLGGYHLTAVDSLSTLAAVGDYAEFHAAAQRVAANVTFDRAVVVSVFEANIRVLGGLLSAHLLSAHPVFGALLYPGYAGQLLHKAKDLGERLLPAFDTPTGIPYHLVHLQQGITPAIRKDSQTCTAAGGTFLLEFTLLSAATGDPRFLEAASRADDSLWRRRDPTTGLVGGNVDVNTGAWLTGHTGVGAGVDSYYENLLKAHVLTGEPSWLARWRAVEASVAAHMRHALDVPGAGARSRPAHWLPDDFDDAHVHVEVSRVKGRSSPHIPTVSALQAFWPGLAVLDGDVAQARAGFRALFAVWRKYKALPEVWDISSRRPLGFAKHAPLRPELMESAYHLFCATGEGAFLEAAWDMLTSLLDTNAVACGFASTADVTTGRLDDRMDSFFIAETLKYAFMVFDEALTSGRGLAAAAPATSHSELGRAIAAALTEHAHGHDALPSTSAAKAALTTWRGMYGGSYPVLAAAASSLLTTHATLRGFHATELGAEQLAQSLDPHGTGQVAAAVLQPAHQALRDACGQEGERTQTPPPRSSSEPAAAWRGLACQLLLPPQVLAGLAVQHALALTVRGPLSSAGEHTHSLAQTGGQAVPTTLVNGTTALEEPALLKAGVGPSGLLLPASAALPLPPETTLFTTEAHMIPLAPSPLYPYQLPSQDPRATWAPSTSHPAPFTPASDGGLAGRDGGLAEVKADGDVAPVTGGLMAHVMQLLSLKKPRQHVQTSLHVQGNVTSTLLQGHFNGAPSRAVCRVLDTVTANAPQAAPPPEGITVGSQLEHAALQHHGHTDRAVLVHGALTSKAFAAGLQASLSAARSAPSPATAPPTTEEGANPNPPPGAKEPVSDLMMHLSLSCPTGGPLRAVPYDMPEDCGWRVNTWRTDQLGSPARLLSAMQAQHVVSHGVSQVRMLCSPGGDMQCQLSADLVGGSSLAVTAAWSEGSATRWVTSLAAGAEFGPELTPLGLRGAAIGLVSPLNACTSHAPDPSAGLGTTPLRIAVPLEVAHAGRHSSRIHTGKWTRPVIAVVARGGCSFATKARAVQAAGAAAMLVLSQHDDNQPLSLMSIGPEDVRPRVAASDTARGDLHSAQYDHGRMSAGVVIPSFLLSPSQPGQVELLAAILGYGRAASHPSQTLEGDSVSPPTETYLWEAVFTAGMPYLKPEREAGGGWVRGKQAQPSVTRSKASQKSVVHSWDALWAAGAAGHKEHHRFTLWPWATHSAAGCTHCPAPQTDGASPVSPALFVRNPAWALWTAHGRSSVGEDLSGGKDLPVLAGPGDIPTASLRQGAAGTLQDGGSGAVFAESAAAAVESALQVLSDGKAAIRAQPLNVLPLPPPLPE